MPMCRELEGLLYGVADGWLQGGNFTAIGGVLRDKTKALLLTELSRGYLEPVSHYF